MTKAISLIIFFALISVRAEENWNWTVNAASIFQVCHIHDVKVTFGDNVPSHCDELPRIHSVDEFFDTKKEIFEISCQDKSNDEPVARRPTAWDRSVRALHWLVSNVRAKVEAFIFVIADAVSDISEASLITKRWQVFWYFIASSTASLMFFAQGLAISRPGKLTFNIYLNMMIGFLITAAFYCCHLYFYNVWVMGAIVLVTLFAFSPVFPQTWLAGLGFFTLMELTLPLLGVIGRFYLDTNLFFGPFLSLVINLGGLLVQSLCFIALYIDEKLMVVKLFFLPFYLMFKRIFTFSKRAGQSVRIMEREAIGLTKSIFTSMQVKPPDDMNNLQKIDKAMTEALKYACKDKTEKFMRVCYHYVRQQCLDTAWSVAFIAYIVATFACGGAANTACSEMRKQSVDRMDDFCKYNNQSAFGLAYGNLRNQLNDLYRQIVIDPLAPKVHEDVLEVTTGFDLFTASWTWWIARILRWVIAAFCLAILFLAVCHAINFLYKYYTDVYFCNNYLSYTKVEEEWRIKLTRKEQTKYYGNLVQVLWDFILLIYKHPNRFKESMRPLVYTAVCWFVEKLAFKLYQLMDSINFVVPEMGDQRFTFNVQGDGILAMQLRLILGGFSIQSKYCKVADSYACKCAFIPVDWQEYMKLFSVAFFYFALGVFQSRSDYFMCRIADFLIPSQGEKRAEVILEDILAERQKRMRVVNFIAQEEIDDPVFDKSKNELILRFYLPRRWYHRFVPTLGLSLIAYFVHGIDNILCQVCGQSLIEGRFKCKKLLVCEECLMFIRSCPCGSELCQDNEAFSV